MKRVNQFGSEEQRGARKEYLKGLNREFDEFSRGINKQEAEVIGNIVGLQRGRKVAEITAIHLHDVHKQSRTDALMEGYLNRVAFLADVHCYFVKHNLKKACIVLLDIDNFKKYNDTYGHNVGDEVLRRYAAFLKHKFANKEAIFSRHGGEEMVIFIPNMSAQEFAGQISSLPFEFSSHNVVRDRKSEQFHITSSIGVSDMNSGADIEAVITCADAAMYTVKKQSKNGVAVYNEGMDVEIQKAD